MFSERRILKRESENGKMKKSEGVGLFIVGFKCDI